VQHRRPQRQGARWSQVLSISLSRRRLSPNHQGLQSLTLTGVSFFGRSWLYNFFLKVLHNAIKNAAEKAVGSAIQNLLNDVRCIQLASIDPL
jgi:hypothetical protein